MIASDFQYKERHGSRSITELERGEKRDAGASFYFSFFLPSFLFFFNSFSVAFFNILLNNNAMILVRLELICVLI